MTDKATMLDEASLAFAELHETRADRRGDGPGLARHAGRARDPKGDAPYPTGTYDDFDGWNARFVDQRTGMKTASVLSEVDVSHRRLIGAAAALPEPLFVPGGAARAPFEDAAAGHYREHAAQIRQWRRK